jgi:UDP-2-acetamido-2-deoxy-ribo-hexuluronate aminotransferase
MTAHASTIRPRDPDAMWRDMGPDYLRLVPGALRGATHDSEYTHLCERHIAQRGGRRHALLCHSGTAALQIALLALGIGTGDEVICPNYGYVASANQARVMGARPRFVDVDAHGHMRVDHIEPLINPRTRAIIVVGLCGDSPDLARIQEIARQHGIRMINDAAQSYFGEQASRTVDQYGDVTCYSFGINKLAHTFCTYGAVATDDPELAHRMRLMRTNGKAGRDHDVMHLGVNSKPHEDKALQVSLALDRVDTWLARRREIADRYDRELDALGITHRQVAADCVPTRTMYPVFFRDRDRAHDLMLADGVQCEKHYRDNFTRTEALSDGPQEPTPGTEALIRSSLSIPLHVYLTDDEVSRVIEVVHRHRDA